MLFIALMFITTSCVAGAAAFFSVYGLAHTFQATFWSVVIMGGSLEAGKLMITSYLYRFRDNLTVGKKAMGIFFVFGLMMVTSLGIYGYLADSYQSGSTGMKQIGASVELKREEQTNLQKRKSEIDSQIARVPDKDTKGKQRLITQFGPEVNTINQRLIAITAELQTDAQKQITTDSHVGPIVFIAKIVGLEPDRAMSYFILIIVFLFDPVAIYLTVATNEAMEKYKRKEKSVPFNPEAIKEDYFFGPHDFSGSTVEHVSKSSDGVKAYIQDVKDQLRAQRITEPESIDVEETDPPVDEIVPDENNEPEFPPAEAWELVPLEVPAPVLQDTFADHPAEEVEVEENVEEDPIETIKEIYQDITSKETQTPLDKESAGMIEKFLARQKLVKDVRTGRVNQ